MLIWTYRAIQISNICHLVIAKLNQALASDFAEISLDFNGSRPQWKTTSMEENPNGRHKWMVTSMEDNLN